MQDVVQDAFRGRSHAQSPGTVHQLDPDPLPLLHGLDPSLRTPHIDPGEDASQQPAVCQLQPILYRTHVRMMTDLQPFVE